jgi:hypothetical protein
MTALKMIFAVVGSLIFLGIFSLGLDTTHNEEIASNSCESKTNNQKVSLIKMTCLTANHTQIIVKG